MFKAPLSQPIDEETIAKRSELLNENNPMMGHRGVRLGITYPEIAEMQFRAILEAAAELIIDGKKAHPTQKPEAIIERMLLASSGESDNILDPFAGSGTTLRVAQVLNRNCIGFELNEDYIKIIENRLQKPFQGFDSVDERKNRKPLNLKENKIELF